jgi:hypothetical protein
LGAAILLPVTGVTLIAQKMAPIEATRVGETAAASCGIPLEKRFDAVNEFREPMFYRGATFFAARGVRPRHHSASRLDRSDYSGL